MDYDNSLLPPTKRFPSKPSVNGTNKKWKIDGLFRLMSSNMSLVRSEDSNYHSKSSDGSVDGVGGKKSAKKGNIKARAEAKRDQLCGDSSMDEGSREDGIRKKKKFLKRGICNGKNVENSSIHSYQQFRDSDQTIDSAVGSMESAIPTNLDNYYCKRLPHHSAQVQQAVQYFSRYNNCNNNAENGHQRYLRRPCPAYREPPKPPQPRVKSCQFVNNIVTNGCRDNYQEKPRFRQRPLSTRSQNVNDYMFRPVNALRDSRYSGIDEHRGFKTGCNLPMSPPDSPYRRSLNTYISESNSPIRARNQSPLVDMNKMRNKGQLQSQFLTNLSMENYNDSGNASPGTVNTDTLTDQRRMSKNLKKALDELEDIYNSLQLDDEELLDRAEQRTMEEFLYKGFTTTPNELDIDDPDSRRKTWGDSLVKFREEEEEEDEISNRLKDDMAYRRTHNRERPASFDGQSNLSNISYLMTSPIPFHRDVDYIDLKKKPRRKEPDITLDDVVFRNIHHANNSLRVIEPQPPFGIPLGPISSTTESSYLQSKAEDLERSRSPYIPNNEPDVVTDDLAVRNLRKDALNKENLYRKNHLDCFSPRISPINNCSPTFGPRKRRNTKSLSANLYGLMNGEKVSPSPDLSEDRFSDILEDCNSLESQEKWENLMKENLDINKNEKVEKFKIMAEQDDKIYNQLCQDLENLTKLSKGIDASLNVNISIKEEEEEEEKEEEKEEVELVKSVNEESNLLSVGNTESSESCESIIYKNLVSAKNEPNEVSNIVKDFENQFKSSEDPLLQDNTMTVFDNPVYKKKDSEEKKMFEDLTKESIKPSLVKRTNSDEVVYRLESSTKEPLDSNNLFTKEVNTKKDSEKMPLPFVFQHSQGQSNNEERRCVAWEGVNKCNHKYNSMSTKNSSFLPFRQNSTTKRQTNKRKSVCSIT